MKVRRGPKLHGSCGREISHEGRRADCRRVGTNVRTADRLVIRVDASDVCDEPEADAYRPTGHSPQDGYFVTRWLEKPTGSIAATIT